MFINTSELIFNQNKNREHVISFKTTKNIKDIVRQVCKDTNITQEIFMNNAILHYLAYSIENIKE